MIAADPCRSTIGIAATIRSIDPSGAFGFLKGQSMAGRRILIVDDDRDASNSLAILLAAAGNATREAHDGVEALEAARHFRPDVILMDIGLPEINGFEVCRRIRAEEWGGAMTIVAVSGWGRDEDRRKSRDAGFDHHLVKPVDYDTLIRLLSEPPPGAPTNSDR
jgi:CheY-like chemotaxis protein